jgi:ubiquinone/menaquinone biosynthesis C-methylase UbiE
MPESDFDVQSSFYAKGYGQVSGIDIKLRAAQVSPSSRYHQVLRQLPAGRSLLDVGCNDGLFLYLARKHFEKLHGVDIVPECLEMVGDWARQTGVELQLHCLNLDTDDFPYPLNYFDAVTCIAVLELVFDPIRLLREMRRVLKPQGALILQLGNIASLRNRLRLMLGKQPWTTRFQGAWNGGALHYFTPGALIALLRGENFEVTELTCSGRLYQIRTLWPTLLGNDMVLVAHKRPDRE